MIGIALILVGILFIMAGMKQQTPVALIKSWVGPK